MMLSSFTIDVAGLDDVRRLAAIVREFAAGEPPLDNTGGACRYCGYDRFVPDASAHAPDCLWRRAVEFAPTEE